MLCVILLIWRTFETFVTDMRYSTSFLRRKKNVQIRINERRTPRWGFESNYLKRVQGISGIENVVELENIETSHFERVTLFLFMILGHYWINLAYSTIILFWFSFSCNRTINSVWIGNRSRKPKERRSEFIIHSEMNWGISMSNCSLVSTCLFKSLSNH